MPARNEAYSYPHITRIENRLGRHSHQALDGIDASNVDVGNAAESVRSSDSSNPLSFLARSKR